MAHRTFLARAGAAALATFADASKLHDMGLPAHFTSLHDSDAASRLASKLPAAAARPILRFDPSLFTSAEGPEEEAAWFDELNLHTEKIIDAAAKADADRLFPYVLCGPQTHAKRAREDLAVYASPSSASPPGSKIMAQMPAVVYASRRDNAACWLADLKPADARFVAMSPAFFHVSPKPAPAKFGPGLVEVEQGSGALKLNALAWAEDPSSGGLEVRFSGGVAASSVPDLAVTWAAADFGLRGDSAQDFLPFAEKGGSAKWKVRGADSKAAYTLLQWRAAFFTLLLLLRLLRGTHHLFLSAAHTGRSRCKQHCRRRLCQDYGRVHGRRHEPPQEDSPLPPHAQPPQRLEPHRGARGMRPAGPCVSGIAAGGAVDRHAAPNNHLQHQGGRPRARSIGTQAQHEGHLRGR